MESRKIIVSNKSGFHVRPAARLSKFAENCSSKVETWSNPSTKRPSLSRSEKPSGPTIVFIPAASKSVPNNATASLYSLNAPMNEGINIYIICGESKGTVTFNMADADNAEHEYAIGAFCKPSERVNVRRLEIFQKVLQNN